MSSSRPLASGIKPRQSSSRRLGVAALSLRGRRTLQKRQRKPYFSYLECDVVLYTQRQDKRYKTPPPGSNVVVSKQGSRRCVKITQHCTRGGGVFNQLTWRRVYEKSRWQMVIFAKTPVALLGMEVTGAFDVGGEIGALLRIRDFWERLSDFQGFGSDCVSSGWRPPGRRAGTLSP